MTGQHLSGVVGAIGTACTISTISTEEKAR